MGRRMGAHARRPVRRLLPSAFAMLSMTAASLGLTAAPAHAGAAIGYACAYYTNVSLFGGPYSVRGCGQTIPPGDAGSASPSVTLPGGGSSTWVSAIDNDGAKGVYGPAVIFGGQYDANDNVGPSGQLSAYAIGTLSTSAISQVQANVVGPAPFHADMVFARCTATTANAKSYLVTLSNAVVETSTDANGYPLTWVNVPSSPSVNYTVSYTLTNIGDHGIVVFNERINNGDGSTTLNAVHMYMQGPIAFGDMVIGQAKCGH
jgi:hypothetical protein